MFFTKKHLHNYFFYVNITLSSSANDIRIYGRPQNVPNQCQNTEESVTIIWFKNQGGNTNEKE